MTGTLTRPSGTWRVESDWPYGWLAVHEDYDGAPIYSDGPPGDDRCFRGKTRDDVVEQIDEYEEEHAA